MIAKLEGTQSNAQQNIEQLQTPTMAKPRQSTFYPMVGYTNYLI